MPPRPQAMHYSLLPYKERHLFLLYCTAPSLLLWLIELPAWVSALNKYSSNGIVLCFSVHFERQSIVWQPQYGFLRHGPLQVLFSWLALALGFLQKICEWSSLPSVSSDEPDIHITISFKRPRNDRSSVTGAPHSSIAFTFCLSILIWPSPIPLRNRA